MVGYTYGIIFMLYGLPTNRSEKTVMNKEGIRLYSIALIAIVLIINIPDVATILQERFAKYQPTVSAVIAANVDNISAAIVPLIGKVSGIPKLFINGKVADVDTNDDFLLTHGQSLSVEQIDTILAAMHSPAEGTGQYWLKYGIEYDIDAAYGLSIFYQESGLGTDPRWYRPGYNTGNITCAGYWQCYGAFRDYSKDANPWASSIKDEMALLRSYRNGGITTYDKAIIKWAPPSENNTDGYINNTKTLIRAWRNTNKIITNDGMPFGKADALSAPITQDTSSAFGINVKAALDANNGALRHITIKDGEQWSFNATVGYVPNEKLAKIVNYGDGWCDLSCRYVQVVHGLGLKISHGTDIEHGDIVFLQHGGIALNNCSVDESPYIWSNGTMGFDNGLQDLIINNRTGKTIKIAVVDNEDNTATVIGRLEQ